MTASGKFTAFTSVPSSRYSRTWSATITAQLSSASRVEAPRCGSATTPGWLTSTADGKSVTWHFSRWLRRPFSTASSSTTPSREKLSSIAPGRISSTVFVLIRWRVLADSGTCSVTKWLAFSTSSSDVARPTSQGTLDAGERGLALLDLLVQIGRRCVQSAHELERGHQVARRHQHPGEHQFLDRVGIRAGGVEHRYAGLGKRRDRDVIDACARAADCLDVGAEIHAVQVLRAHQHDLGSLGFLDDGVALRGQAFEADLRDLVQHQDFDLLLHALSHGVARTPSGNRRGAARPPSALRCRSRRACRRPSGGP